jgi:Uma2 family endonuclease
VGEVDHSDLQSEIVYQLRPRRRESGVWAAVEQRVQVSPTKFRVPDVCVVLGGKPKEKILHTPPFVCIEVLSPEDRLSRVQRKMDDFLKFGVPYVWLLDPETRKAHRWTNAGMLEVSELRTENPEIVIPLAEPSSSSTLMG